MPVDLFSRPDASGTGVPPIVVANAAVRSTVKGAL
jgi:hypothetical protein